LILSSGGRHCVGSELASYARTFDVSTPTAEGRLDVQGRTWDAVGRLSEALGERYGGLWFDNATGRLEVGVVGGQADAAPADSYLARAELTGAADVVPERYSYDQLMKSKQALDNRFGELPVGTLTTSISEKDNEVVVSVSDVAPQPTLERVQSEAAAEPVRISVVTVPPSATTAVGGGCSNTELGDMFCDYPLRGGVGLVDQGVGGIGTCSMGYIVTSGTQEYVMTAGHCMGQEAHPSWVSAAANFNSTKHWFYIGNVANNLINSEADIGVVAVDQSGKSGWYPMGNPNMVANLQPGGNGELTLENIAWPIEGGYNCRTGTRSDTQCGQITSIDKTVPVNFGRYGVISILEDETSECMDHGDSGGTVWGNHSGLGMADALSSECGSPESHTLFTAAIRDLWTAFHGALKFHVPPYGETY
jgi:hypothetical protein